MKTAVCIFGHMRTFARCLPTIQWHVLRHFSEVDFYVATIRDRDSDTAELLREAFPKSRVEIEVIDGQPELPIPVPPTAKDWTLGRFYTHEPYNISVHPQAILRQLWQWERGWKFMESKGHKTGDYGVYLRVRPDSWFRDVRISPFDRALTMGPQVFTPWWGRFGGCNDRFAIMGSQAAEAYFTTYSRIPELIAKGCPLHPESLLRASLEHAGCIIDDTLWADFCKLYGSENPKLAGSFREPEITTQDLAHLAAHS